MSGWRVSLGTLVALAIAALSLFVLEAQRAGVEISRVQVGQTPVTVMRGAEDGPAVVIAHGFAGSRQMMQGYGLVLAQAGYRVFAFDFEGHGRHPVPMRGDLDAVEGTTRYLVAQTLEVVKAAQEATGSETVALLGHSMATDVLVRVAQETGAAGPLVLLSAFSKEITATHPQSLLLVTGAWEPGLAGFAEDALWMVDADAALGETATRGEVSRRAVLAPFAEHVSILHSRVARQEALDWLNRYYGRNGQATVWPTGWALLGLLAALTALFAPVARVIPASGEPARALTPMGFALVLLPAAVITPLVAVLVNLEWLPVLVADYLAVHLALYGLLLGGLLLWLKGAPWRPDLTAAVLLAFWGVLVFGMALDRYGANFWPTPDRLSLMGALCVGAIPFMLADSWLAHGAPLWQRVVARVAFLASLGAAVALDFERLFFLIMIAPVILLFFLTFGVMGRMSARQSGPASAGLGLGLALAWAIGVSFPLFQA
ncbi:MAG: alpha/beta hydrolase [Roseovarius sp.]